MDWPIVTLVCTLTITFLGFIWGIIRVNKKPEQDTSWKEPLGDFEKKVEEDLEKQNDKISGYRNKIHDLEKDKDILTKTTNDLKDYIGKVSGKCDDILQRFIKYIQSD